MASAHIAGRWGMTLGARALHARYSRAVAIWLASLIYGLILALNGATLVGPPRLALALSTPLAGYMRVAWVLPGGALWDRGIRAGDAVIALDGHLPAHEDAGLWTGRRVRVRLSHGGHATVTVDVAALPDRRVTWPLLALSPWFMLLATLVALRAPQPAVGRATYLFFASAACALALAPGADANDAAAVAAGVAEWVMIAIFAACFVGFFLVYPTPRGAARLRIWLFAPPLAGVLLGVAALRWPGLYTPAYLVRMAILLGYLLAGVGLLVWSFATSHEREGRHGLVIIGAGTAASVSPFAALYLLPTVLGHPPLLAAERAILALAFLPASFAYAILRHRALGVPLLQRWLVRGTLWGGLLALCVVVAYAAETLPLAAFPEPLRGIAFDVALMAFAGVSVTWLRERGWRFIDRLIFKDAYDYRASLQGLSRDLSLAGNLDTLGARLPGTLRRLMNLDFAILLVHDARGLSLCGDAGAYQPALLPDVIAAAGEVRDEPRAVSLAYGYLTVLVVPLHTHDALMGSLCLGPKASGEPFRAEDRALLATLSGHLAALVRNVQLVADLRAQACALGALNERLSHTQEEERARLATDLHDEPLQTAIALQRAIADDGRNRASTAGHIALSQTLIAQLRALCTAMRPAALDHLGLHAALDQLARERGGHAGCTILVDVDPEVAELDLPADAELVLYRAAQEALNNCLRHARPRTVRIAVQRQGQGVRLAVADDGRGFAVPARFDDFVHAGHLGLVGMRERVQHAGGRLHVTSAPGAGTSVQVDLPLQRAPERAPEGALT